MRRLLVPGLALLVVVAAGCSRLQPTDIPASPSEPPSAGGVAPSAAAEGSGATRDNAIAAGQSARVGDWQLQVVGFTNKADEAIHRENEYNDEPKAGNQYVLVSLRAAFEGSGSDTPCGNLSFQAIPDSGEVTPTASSLTIPEDLCQKGTVPSGAHAVGNVAFEVNSQDANSLVLYVSDYSGENPGVFFAL